MGKGKRSSDSVTVVERETEKRSSTSKKKMKRSPVIIYSDETPKVILADATQFMRMVQSLTGSGSSSSSPAAAMESAVNCSSRPMALPISPPPDVASNYCCPDQAPPLGNREEPEESYDSASTQSSSVRAVSSPESVSFSEAELLKLCEETESSLWTWPLPPPPPSVHDYDWPISSTEPDDLMLFFEQDMFFL